MEGEQQGFVVNFEEKSIQANTMTDPVLFQQMVCEERMKQLTMQWKQYPNPQTTIKATLGQRDQ